MKLELSINEQIVSVKTATDDIQELTEEEQQFAYNVPDSTKKLYH